MSWRVIMTDTAKNDLWEIAFSIYQEAGDAETAARFVLELREKCSMLEEFPERGANPKDHILKAQGYRYLVHKHYLIFYLTDSAEKKVFIQAFFHEKLDYFRRML